MSTDSKYNKWLGLGGRKCFHGGVWLLPSSQEVSSEREPENSVGSDWLAPLNSCTADCRESPHTLPWKLLSYFWSDVRLFTAKPHADQNFNSNTRFTAKLLNKKQYELKTKTYILFLICFFSLLLPQIDLKYCCKHFSNSRLFLELIWKKWFLKMWMLMLALVTSALLQHL